MKYSIITPVYNREDCIARCIESVIANLSKIYDVEHIIVDDGSTDKTPLIVEKYAEQYQHIRYVRRENNGGTNAARNAAIAIATGEYCVILDSDDYFVQEALVKVNDIVSKEEYKAYMFAADDMQESYSSNALLRGHRLCEIQYEDFLSGKVGGDFIHCISTKILKAHPFREDLRIHEGIFFLLFFRDAQKMLFTNEVITIRERSRQDSVTRTVIRTNKEIIKRCYDAASLQLDLFKDDYKRYNMVDAYNQVLYVKVENGLLLLKYREIQEDVTLLSKKAGRKVALIQLLYKYRLGIVYSWLLQIYLRIKYNLLHHTVS